MNQPVAFPSPVVTARGGESGLDFQTLAPVPGDGPSWTHDINQSILAATAGHDSTRAAMSPQVSREEGTSTVADTWASAQAIDAYVQPDQVNFANWLLDPPDSQTGNYELPEFPFLDYSMVYSPADTWGLEQVVNPDNLETRNQQCRSTSTPQEEFSTQFNAHLNITEDCRSSIANTLKSFLTKKRPPALSNIRQGSLLSTTDYCLFPDVTTDILRSYLAAFWQHVAKQMPILHQPTFSASSCHQHLLLAMVALGAAQLVRLSPKGTMQDHKDLADLVVINLRWEILTDDDAQPPMQLWAAQALLLIELYEKMYSTRSLHERAHIYHASTITLLRRGNPLVARDGSETPPSGMPTRCVTPDEANVGCMAVPADGPSQHWRRWSRVESMKRVVFAAFQMDALHAVLFGHESALFPYEVRLALPCDDTIWDAGTPEEVERLEASFSMHGVKSINFLDGLKRCLHGQEAQSHHDGRIILMSGLLSVSWHLSKRETHLQFLETVPVAIEQERWRLLLHNAFGSWRRSFEQALSGTRTHRSRKTQSADRSPDPAVLFHLANITARVDIVDLQILAGSKRLLGRKVSGREHTRVVHRMRQWAATDISRTAVHHAFKLLHETLTPSNGGKTARAPRTILQSNYACRADPSIYRPWVLYLAALTTWASQYCSAQSVRAPVSWKQAELLHDTALRYVCTCADVQNAERLPLVTSSQGCCALLQLLAEDFANAESELLIEACKRLRQCQVLLNGAVI